MREVFFNTEVCALLPFDSRFTFVMEIIYKEEWYIDDNYLLKSMGLLTREDNNRLLWRVVWRVLHDESNVDLFYLFKKLDRKIPFFVLVRKLNWALKNGLVKEAEEYAGKQCRKLYQREYIQLLEYVDASMSTLATDRIIDLSQSLTSKKKRIDWLERALSRSLAICYDIRIVKCLNLLGRKLSVDEHEVYIKFAVSKGFVDRAVYGADSVNRSLSEREIETMFYRELGFGKVEAALSVVSMLMHDWLDMDYYLNMIRLRSLECYNVGLYVQVSELMEKQVCLFDIDKAISSFCINSAAYGRENNFLSSLFECRRKYFSDTLFNISQFDPSDEIEMMMT